MKAHRAPAATLLASKKARRRVAALLLALLVMLAMYVGFVVRAGFERIGDLRGLAAQFDQSGLKSSDLPAGWIHDLLTVEDPGFYDHNGVDLWTPGAGLTTITQGLVKIHYFEDFQPGGLAKFRQSILALVLDSRLTKEQQLTLLLNTARLGNANGQQVVGFGQAAEIYFGKPVDRVSYTEFISIVAMLVGPNQYNVLTHPAENKERVARIVALLSGECTPVDSFDVYYKAC